MNGGNHIGIYISKDTASVVCLASQGRERNITACFSVSVDKQQEADPQALASLIAQGCAEKIPMFRNCDAAVALDCAMFMQHSVRSAFSDPKQIASTVRFDTEEALSTDISDMAIAFRISSTDEKGAALTVFTAKRKLLTDILLALQNNNIDPVTMEPDVNCLSRFISQKLLTPENAGDRTLFGMLSRRNGYFIVPDLAGSQKQPAMRTFLIGPAQNRNELLAREMRLTSALVKTGEPINHLKVLDSTGSVNHQQLTEKLGIEVGCIVLAESAGAVPETLAGCADVAEFVIAYGAALATLEKTQNMNLRNDFMPYEGRKIRLQKTIKFLSISAAIILFAIGLYFQLELLRLNKPISKLKEKFRADYTAIIPGETKLPAKPLPELERKLRRIREVKSGQLTASGEASISAKLTLILEAFNKCAANTNLNIDTFSITTKTISITGSTSSRQNTINLRKAIEECGLKISQDRLEEKQGRDNFTITIMPKE